MDKATLVVQNDLALGYELLAAMDQSELQIQVAMWVYLSDYEEWRFLVASPRLDQMKGTEAYGAVLKTVPKDIPWEMRLRIMILEMSDPFVREIRKRYSKSKRIEGSRFGLQLIGGRFVEDALVYRVR